MVWQHSSTAVRINRKSCEQRYALLSNGLEPVGDRLAETVAANREPSPSQRLLRAALPSRPTPEPAHVEAGLTARHAPAGGASRAAPAMENGGRQVLDGFKGWHEPTT